jgi:DNA-binding CsgD family transcriptional regulator
MKRVSTTSEIILSAKEQRIARLLAWGMIQKEIADKLRISQQTVSVHLRNIYRKLEIHKETDLCRWWIFYEYGIADNPFKRVVAVLFIILSFSLIMTEIDMVRVFRSAPLNPATRVARVNRTARSRKYYNVINHKLQYC